MRTMTTVSALLMMIVMSCVCVNVYAFTDDEALALLNEKYVEFARLFNDEEFDQVADMFYCPDATFVPSFSDSFFLPQEAISGVLEGAYTGIQLTAPGKKFILKSVAAQVKNDEMIEEVGAALVEGIPGASGPFPSYFYGLWQRGCDPNEPDEYKLLVDVISIVTGPPYVDPRDEFMSPSPEDDDDEMD